MLIAQGSHIPIASEGPRGADAKTKDDRIAFET
jgi:hypothetical protein